MSTVNTVRGELNPKDIGKTLMHEHFVFGYPGYNGDETIAPYDERKAMDIGKKVIEDVREFGFETIIDVTPNDCGRNPQLLKKIAEENNFNIICATGYYYQGEGAPAYFSFRNLFTDIVEELTELMVKEITVGINNTGIRAGVIKTGTSAGIITDYEKSLLKAAAKAQKMTGVPILTHTQSGTMGPEQAEILINEGADPSKIIIGHMCGNVKDFDYQQATLKYGVGIGFDRIGTNELFCDITDDDRIRTIVKLIELGYKDRIFLSHDSVNYWLGRDVSGFYEIPGAKYWSIRRIGEYIVPKLKEQGVTDDILEEMMGNNIRKLWI